MIIEKLRAGNAKPNGVILLATGLLRFLTTGAITAGVGLRNAHSGEGGGKLYVPMGISS